MADTTFATNAAAGGASFNADADGGSALWPYVKMSFGASGTQTRVTTAAGLPVQQQSGATFTVVGAAADGAAAAGNPVLVAGFDGTNAQSISVTSGGLVQIHDAAGSITVDNGGTFAVQAAVADGADVTLGAKADAKSTATDTTAVTAMSVLKQISASVQAPPSQATTNAGTFVVQENGAALTALQLIDDPVATLGTTTYSEATTKGMIVGAVRRDADTTLVDTTNEVGPLQMDANGRLKVEAFSGETLPVSGTVTANLAAGTNNIGDVDVLTVPADPFGANADAASATGSISAKLRFIAGTGIPITGTVTVGSHAVTATDLDIRDLTSASDSVAIGGSALTSLQLIDDAVYAEDVAAQAADKGLAILAVRRDANTTLVDTTGDYANLQVDASGSLKVAITAGAGSGGTSIADDAAFTVASTSLTPVGGVYESTPDAVDDGDAGAFHMTAKRAMWVNLRDNSGNELSVGGGTQYDEDAASAGAEKLTLAGAVRRDTAASSSTTDGDYSTINTDATGRLWAHVGTIDGGTITTITNVVHVDDNAGSLTVDNGGTFAVQATLAAGAAAIAKAEDVASADADVGVPAMMVRKATPANTSNADGDYEFIQGSAGRLWVDPSGVTLTVASHAVTNAGTFAVQVDGSALTSLQLIDDPVIADDAAFTPATSKVMMAGFEYDDTGTDSVDEGDAGAARMSANRNIYMNIRDAAGNERGANVNASNQLSVVEASGASALTSLQLIDDTVFVDDAAFTPGTSKGLAVGFQADESSTDSIDEGDFGVPRMTLDRKTIVTTLPHTTGGLTTFMASASDGSSILVATSQAVKASAGMLYGYYIYNPEAAVSFVHFYNTASASVTVGTTNPLFTVAVPAGAAANLAIPQGIVFSNAGWAVAATTTAGGNTAPATGVSLVAWYA